MNENNRNLLGYEEFRGHFFENISRIIINQNYIDENFDFFEKVIFKLWENYYYNSNIENISITKQLNLFEIFLSAMIELKPSNQLPEDVI